MALLLLPVGRAFADFTANNAALSFNNADFITSTITINANGTLSGGNSRIGVSGDWLNSGTFYAGASTVAFENSAATSAITGNNTFYSLTSDAAGKTITFAAGSSQTVTNVFSVAGLPGNLVQLRSSDDASKWYISFPNGPQTVTYADIKDSNANLNTVSARSSLNSGNNNAGWDFGITSAKSGPWSDPATWNSGTVPSSADAVIIATGHNVVLDIMNAVSSTATINGRLMASRMVSSSWTLVGGDINVNAGGTLDYGNEADAIPTAINAHLVLAYGATAGQYGLIVNNGGNFTVRGSTKTPYAFAGASIGTGDNDLKVYGSTSVAGWQPGDVITIGPTSGNGPATVDSRVITSVTGGNPYIVSWSGGPLGTARTLTPETPIIVGNLTRNVLVRSSGTVVDNVEGNTAYILNLAQNTTSFTLTYGEFAYLGSVWASKYSITFNELSHGSISSSTMRNGGFGVLFYFSSTNTLTGNNIYANAFDGIQFSGSHDNFLTGNNISSNQHGIISSTIYNNTLIRNYSYANTGYGIYIAGNNNAGNNNTLIENNAYSNGATGISIYQSSNNTLIGNKSYFNSTGIGFDSSSNNNTVTGNNVYDNSSVGFSLTGASGNIFIGNNSYSNSDIGIMLYSCSNTTLLGNSFYSNSNYGIYIMTSPGLPLFGNTFVDGNFGYNAAGNNFNNTLGEVYFGAGITATLTFKGVRVNPAVGISTAGMSVEGTSLISYNQDADTGTVRIWGNYQLAGSTLTLDYATQLYASNATVPKLMRGTGHSAAVSYTSDLYAVSQLITITYRSGAWHVDGSSTGADMKTFTGTQVNMPVPADNSQFNLNFAQEGSPQEGDIVDFVLTAASKDANTQKKLLFGPAASSFNSGRSKLEIDATGGIILHGKSDGSANTLVDRLSPSASTYYTFVDSGAFIAEHSSFANMDSDGVQLSGTKSVDISSSTFDYLGFASGTNTYITARDLTSNATFYNVAFGLSRSSAGYDSAHNVLVDGNDTGLNWDFNGTPAGLLWGEAYDYDPNNKVAWSSADNIPPMAVTDLTGINVSTDAVALSWTAPGNDWNIGTLDNSAFTVQYATYTAVDWSTSAAQVNVSTTGVNPGTTQYYAIGGLLVNTGYYFRIWSNDDFGNYSGMSNLVSTYTLAAVPGAASVPFTEVTANSFTANWTANGNSGETMYHVQISTVPDFSAGYLSSITYSLQLTSYDLSPISYYTRVAAINNNGIYSDYLILGNIEINSSLGSDIDCGYRVFDGTATVTIACEPPGLVTSPLRIGKNGQTYGIMLVPVDDPDATKQLIKTGLGVKALKRLFLGTER